MTDSDKKEAPEKRQKWLKMLEESEVERTVVQKSDGVPENQMMLGWGKSEYDPEGGLIVYFSQTLSGSPVSPLIIYPKKEFRIGRREVVDDSDLDLNLAQYGGSEAGVSRVHAILNPNENKTLSIVDMGSTNGTFVNEQQLEAKKPRVLRSGDTIRLGQVVFHVYFK